MLWSNIIKLGLVYFCNSISTFMGYLMPKPSLLKNSCGTIWHIAREVDKGFYYFPKGISLKVNVKVLWDFELAYYEVVVQHISPLCHDDFLLIKLGNSRFLGFFF